MNHLDALEAEAIYILREGAGQFGNAALMFSGGKDSTVLVYLALKAFHPARPPFTVLHVDTGHNFPEALAFRDELVAEAGLQLVVIKVEDTIKAKGLTDATGKLPSRNVLQSATLMDAIHEHGYDACIGGGRRDEEKARAKERIFSVRDSNGAWQPYNQRPELWDVYNGRLAPPRPSPEGKEMLRKELCGGFSGEHMRVFPISNWSELDVWHYIRREKITLPSLYFAHERECLMYNGRLIATSGYITIDDSDVVVNKTVRYRTVGDMTCTAAVESIAATIDEVIDEITGSVVSERGETRIDDQFSDAAMEDRKLKGYF